MTARAYVLTVSDRCFAGEMEDTSGPAVTDLLEGAGIAVEGYELVPDSRDQIIDALLGAVAHGFDLVVTSGGTGLGPRDLTPQATAALIDFEVPGMAEEMRRVGMASTPHAMISRGIVGVRARTLIVNLPGSERAATESLSAVLAVLPHALDLLQGHTQHAPAEGAST
ncbi:MAG TPA: MogA/MoaB family molybdenum cofactor biosynthesis protein [Candidatus Dormibacteraeota bacterium]